jgi:hypothetical protein
MSDFAADDFAEIGRRLRELKEEAEPCKTCPDCRNPNGVPQP